MSDESFFNEYLDHFSGALKPSELFAWLSSAKERVEATRDAGGRLLFAGNGASATMASHYALDFTKQGGVRSLCFNDAALITAYANDYGYEQWVARAVEHHGNEGDVAVLISSSGRSPNIVKAAEVAAEKGIQVLSLTGFDASNALREGSDLGLWVDSRSYNVIEAVHAVWLGLLCDMIIGAREYSVSG